MTAQRLASPLTPDEASALVDPSFFQSRGYPHHIWSRLRAEAPVSYVETEHYEPFWAVTKYHDIRAVNAQPSPFSSAHGVVVHRKGTPKYESGAVLLLDPPEHGPLRRAAIRRFTPMAIESRSLEIDRIVAETVAEIPDGESFDFVADVAAPISIAVIAWILGVPRADWRLLLRWTNEVIGKDDPEFRRPGETPLETATRARREIHAYLGELVELRRRDAQDDLVSHLLDAEVAGVPLTDEQLLDYCELLIEAGNETTRNALAGGMIAFAEHPAEWSRLRDDPQLLTSAVDEVVRWSSPVIHMARVALEDASIGGVMIPAGDKVALFYPSGHRDEDVFEDPFTFRIDRDQHWVLGFGFGTHYCMGVHVARTEIGSVLRRLAAIVEELERSGPVERLSANMVGGVKRLPVRVRRARRPD